MLLLALVACDRSQPVEPATPAARSAMVSSSVKAPSGTNALAVSVSRIDVSGGGQLDERDWIRGTAAEGYLRFVDLETGDLGETVSEGRSFTTRAAPGTAFRGSAVGPTAVASHSPHRRGWMLTRDPISMDDR